MSRTGRYALDTSVLVEILRGDPRLRETLARVDAAFLPATAVGELYYGALYSSSPARQTASVTALVADGRVLACDEATALVWGNLKTDLRRRGRLIPDNDLWIAAVAVQHDLTVATRDAHFGVVGGLQVEIW